MPEELRTEVHNTVQEGTTKIITKENKSKKAKWLSEVASQIVEQRREVKDKRERDT